MTAPVYFDIRSGWVWLAPEADLGGHWRKLGGIQLWSGFEPMREIAACRVISADGASSVDTFITREAWAFLWPAYKLPASRMSVVAP